jgi:hypothetical protein
MMSLCGVFFSIHRSPVYVQDVSRPLRLNVCIASLQESYGVRRGSTGMAN